MHGLGSTGDAAHRPYFFLSYAHTPRSDPRDGDPDLWVERLYQDLCAHILQMTTLPAGAPPGFMDRGMHLGEGWPERLSEALAHCRVFVPLYSPRYFRSEQCGKEWYAFSQRAVYQRAVGDSTTSAIVPALWVAPPLHTLPDQAERLQFNHGDFGNDYATEGFYGLIKLSYLRGEYERAVYRLAQRIVKVAEDTSIAPGRQLDYRSVPSAFGTPGPARALQVTVLACCHSDLPAARSRAYYGPSPGDWNPYHPHSTRPLADYATDIARNLNYRVSVGVFEDEVERMLEPGPPSAPGILLLDRWALEDPGRRELLKRFGAEYRPWVSVLVPWNREDSDATHRAEELRDVVEQTLSAKLGEGRTAYRLSRNGIATLEAFGDEFPLAVERAAQQYATHAPTFPPPGPSTPRPRLTGPVTSGRGTAVALAAADGGTAHTVPDGAGDDTSGIGGEYGDRHYPQPGGGPG